jgi:hypothetical protein
VEVPGSGSSLDTERIALPVRVERKEFPARLTDLGLHVNTHNT